MSQPWVAKWMGLDELLGESDVVTIHCPLTPETRGMIDERRIALMKTSAYLINAARGGIVNEDALCHALQQRKIAGAALDVVENEPPARNHPLFQLDNVVLTNTPYRGAHI